MPSLHITRESDKEFSGAFIFLLTITNVFKYTLNCKRRCNFFRFIVWIGQILWDLNCSYTEDQITIIIHFIRSKTNQVLMT